MEGDTVSDVRMSDIAKKAGVSRQAVYLHFPSRADLLIATTRFIDDVNNVDKKLEASRSAKTGRERLAAYIEMWGHYVPLIYGTARALLAMKDTDSEASAAWHDRMNAHREGCEAAIIQLQKDGELSNVLNEKHAIDWLWNLLSVRNWESLTQDCGWPKSRYIKVMQQTAEAMLLKKTGD